MVALWCVFLFLQNGNHDEDEHAHTAWLMAQGLRPLTDFFQHHQPVMWDVLRAYYALGLKGAEVLIWGRVVVVVCGLFFLVVLEGLTRATGPDWESSHGTAPALPRSAPGALIFMAFTIAHHSFFVIRPEALAVPLALSALWTWISKAHRERSGSEHAIAAGILYGAAVYTSPRMILLGGYFLLLAPSLPRLASSLFWAFLGSVLFIAGYSVFFDYPLDRVIFNLRFSPLVQTSWDVALTLRLTEIRVALWVLAILGGRIVYLPRGSRAHATLLFANTAAVFGLSTWLGTGAYFSQCFAAFYAGAAISFALLGWRIGPWSERRVRLGLGLTLFCAIKLIGMLDRPTALDFLADVRQRSAIAALVGPGERVLILHPIRHPIAALDASYYGCYDRTMCQVGETFAGPPTLPRCDYLEVLFRDRPLLIDATIEGVLPAARAAEWRPVLRQRYRPYGNRLLIRIGPR